MSANIHLPTAMTSQLSLYEQLVELVSKRVATIQYIKKAHEGNTHWLNTVLLTKENLELIYSNSKMVKRTYTFYVLGLSLATILNITNPVDYIKALNQVMNEFERFTDESKQKMKNIFRKTDNVTDYGYLILPHIPFEMDYVETFLTLSNLISEAYHKLLVDTEGPICTQSFFELVLKFDSKIKKITLLITKELDSIAREVIKDELKMIDPTSFTTKTDYPIELEMNTET